MEKLVGRYSLIEEIINATTHGIGILLSIVGLAVLVAYASLTESATIITSCAIFGASLIFAYTSSTLYHAITNEKAKQIFRQFDHASIYLLIAGTYTPVVLVLLGNTWGWSIFFIIWSVAIVGIVLKFVCPHRFKKLSVVLYITMGWFVVVAINQLMENMAVNGLWLMLIGGLFYSIGVIFYVRKSIPYNHAIWHIFVLCGSISHYFMVLFYVLP
ncbi:PAQR family membrane homeostasis protein TrhA [Sulfurospirillum arcachonense]|uniref:PAQR family membrane homeostasis protein TrhA n=1 Tax=Sulfurospirillum arcachonense TaxID=57666 RepID=UPI000468474E|nr:hemolysin III family protein [Sulfurospirillum arcachonense]